MHRELPSPERTGGRPLAECLGERRSVRDYANAPISLAELSQLLWAMQGETGAGGQRASPSAGGLYPLRVHVRARRVSDLPSGIYAYDGAAHGLESLGDGIGQTPLADVGIGDQPWLEAAAAVVGIGAELERVVSHFEAQNPRGARGMRYVFIETGAAAQNAHLQATALGLGFVLVAGFHDDEARAALRFGDDVAPTALLCIGRPHG